MKDQDFYRRLLNEHADAIEQHPNADAFTEGAVAQIRAAATDQDFLSDKLEALSNIAGLLLECLDAGPFVFEPLPAGRLRWTHGRLPAPYPAQLSQRSKQLMKPAGMSTWLV